MQIRLPAPLFLFALPLLCGAPAFCQGAGVFLEPRLSAGSDIQIGVRAGLADIPVGRGSAQVFLDGEGRPWTHAVRERQTPTLTHQYRETRYTIGPGASLWIPIAPDWFLATGLGAAYTLGDYRGSNRNPASGWIGWGEAGAIFAWSESVSLGATLQYRPLPGLAPVRVLLQCSWRWR